VFHAVLRPESSQLSVVRPEDARLTAPQGVGPATSGSRHPPAAGSGACALDDDAPTRIELGEGVVEQLRGAG
jgi:hypothetical protein